MRHFFAQAWRPIKIQQALARRVGQGRGFWQSSSFTAGNDHLKTGSGALNRH
jgi:hypothetical protein